MLCRPVPEGDYYAEQPELHGGVRDKVSGREPERGEVRAGIHQRHVPGYSWGGENPIPLLLFVNKIDRKGWIGTGMYGVVVS